MRVPVAAMLAASLVALVLGACKSAPEAREGGSPGRKVRVTFFVKAPASTPGGALYLASNAGGWNPGDEDYRLGYMNAGTWKGSFDFEPGSTLEYKITRGAWDSVEKSASGAEIGNRRLLLPADQGEARVDIEVGAWSDLPEETVKNTIANKGIEIITGFDLAELGARRTIRIWLPPGYAGSERRYPVLYMHDGQNLFDAATSFAGEWKIDEALAAVDAGDDGSGTPLAAIVVGIDNGGSERLNEYSPFPDPRIPSPRGDRYIASIVKNLKPWIDARYRTLADRAHTWIGGSSMGGLISLYAVQTHPEVFSKALCLSSAFYIGNNGMLGLIESKGMPGDLAVYLDVGGREWGSDDKDASMVADSRKIYEALLAAGLGESQLRFVIDPGAVHNEGAWAKRFPAAYAWLRSAPTQP